MHLVTTQEMYIIVGTHADIVQECWLIVFNKICENKVLFDFVFYTQYTFKSLEQAILKLFKILPFLKFLYQLSTFQYYFIKMIGPGFFPLQILIIKLDIQIRRINVSVRYNFFFNFVYTCISTCIIYAQRKFLPVYLIRFDLYFFNEPILYLKMRRFFNDR